MLVGVPKEIKDNEFRVGRTPAAGAELVHHGHEVIVETGAGLGSGSQDDEYVRAGAKIVATGADVYSRAEMIVKVTGRSSAPTCLMVSFVSEYVASRVRSRGWPP